MTLLRIPAGAGEPVQFHEDFQKDGVAASEPVGRDAPGNHKGQEKSPTEKSPVAHYRAAGDE